MTWPVGPTPFADAMVHGEHMATLVDAFPYPWHLPEAQELHATLSDMYPTSRAATFVAAKAGLNTAMLFQDTAAFSLWRDILDTGAGAQKNRDVVRSARDQSPTNPRRPFLDALLAVNPVAVAIDHQERDGTGAPIFIRANDGITEPEALLFHDDLTLAIGRVPWMISVLQRLQAIAPAVCRLRSAGLGVNQYGTGFRIANDLLLTNWHVVTFGATTATGILAEFGFDDDGQGGGTASTAVQCDVTTIQGDASDDWAVVRVAQPMAANIPVIKLSDAADPTLNAPAFLVQHPGGNRKRIAFVRNQITSFDDRVVHYLSDTQAGSSGSPVLDDQGRLVGLHRAGGRPQEVAGKPPLRKNEGVRIPRVRNGLAQRGIAVP